MLFELKNFSSNPSPKCKPGDTFRMCNFSQPVAHTPICEGVDGLMFEKCNLNNCDLPKGAVAKDSLHVHAILTPVVTLTKNDILERELAMQAAVDAAEIAAKEAIAVVPVGATIADLQAKVDEKKDAEISAAIAALKAQWALDGKPNVDGLVPTFNPDGSVTYSSRTWEYPKAVK